jgi:hypothetical protein
VGKAKRAHAVCTRVNDGRRGHGASRLCPPYEAAAAAPALRDIGRRSPGLIKLARVVSSAASTNDQNGTEHLLELRGVGENSEDRQFASRTADDAARMIRAFPGLSDAATG